MIIVNKKQEAWRRSLSSPSETADAADVDNMRCYAPGTFGHGVIIRLTCLRGAFPPVDLRAVCLVRAMVVVEDE